MQSYLRITKYTREGGCHREILFACVYKTRRECLAFDFWRVCITLWENIITENYYSRRVSRGETVRNDTGMEMREETAKNSNRGSKTWMQLKERVLLWDDKQLKNTLALLFFPSSPPSLFFSLPGRESMCMSFHFKQTLRTEKTEFEESISRRIKVREEGKYAYRAWTECLVSDTSW